MSVILRSKYYQPGVKSTRKRRHVRGEIFKTFSIQLTESEWLAFAARARNNGVSRAEFMRLRCCK